MRHACLLACLAVAAPAAAQCTPSTTNFCVTEGPKTPANPNPGGWPETYYINGIEAPVVTLTRGETYTFTMVNVDPFHPFYISTNSIGSGTGWWMQGVNPTLVSGNQVMTFDVPLNAPATLWYGCFNHPQMGWRIDIEEPVPTCYPNCDGSTIEPILNVADFSCFLGKFAAGDPYANCDGSTIEPVLNVADFSCFLGKFAAGCR
jgi:hypothetical protein